jgi:diguanylate cyclase (GGDEF)-like protein
MLICNAGISHEKSGICTKITISLGVGTIVPADIDKLTDFIEAVDKQLYQAKQNGRNRVAAAGPAP